MSLSWKLREHMAKKGIWRCTDLAKLLNQYGIRMSVSAVTRLVEKLPERLDTKVMEALCDLLDCPPTDLFGYISSGRNAELLAKAVGENLKIKPGPKPKNKMSCDDIPDYILGPEGGVIK